MICTTTDTKLINEIMRDFTNITKIAAIFAKLLGAIQPMPNVVINATYMAD